MVVGFSMGGHWSLWMAQQPNPRISRVVAYYAARGGAYSGAPLPVLAHFAERDPFVSAGSRRSMTRSLHTAGRPYVSHEYPGTSHWFAESAHPAYDRAAADLALRRTAEFLAGR